MDTTSLEAKAVEVFGNLVIDKRRLPASKLTSQGLPGYVAEWVLSKIVPGPGPLSLEDAQKVQEWATGRVPRPDERNLLMHRLQQGNPVKVITPVQVDVYLDRKRKDRVAKLPNIGIFDAHISDALLEANPDLLHHGMWGITELLHVSEGITITSFEPLQAKVSLSLWKEARRSFSLLEWRTLLLQSMGYNPSAYSEAEQTLMLARLLPLVQKNMHLMELAPKGTGKSYIYENVSPRVRLLSGGTVSPAVLFVNNANGLPGLLARYAVVVLDEVQTAKFEDPAQIVGGLKGYLANGLITRGGLHEIPADAGFVLLANITLDEQLRPVKYPLISELPAFLQETAFIDRIKGLIPGWELPKLTSGSFAQASGLKADYFGNILIALRDDLSADSYCSEHVQLGGRAYRRNEESVRALASGFMKLQFPHGEASEADFDTYCVQPAIKLRQGIWDQLYALDGEYRGKFDKLITLESAAQPAPAQ
ncbi:BREX system Lon protease-like protein BrxL [Hymenobacter ruber]